MFSRDERGCCARRICGHGSGHSGDLKSRSGFDWSRRWVLYFISLETVRKFSRQIYCDGSSFNPFLSLRQMETLEQLRRKLVSLCIGTELEEAGVHTVTFQPLLSRVNQDRVVTESWDISGQTWVFLAVCDGEF